jgi:hypothetical protein
VGGALGRALSKEGAGDLYLPSDDSSGDGHEGRPQASTSAVAAAFAQLHLLPSAPAWAAEAVYRAAVRVYHPDVGGDGRVMTRLNLVMETIRKHQQQESKVS